MESDLLAKIQKLQNHVKIPSKFSKVYKEECMVSFDNPFSKNGIYVNLSTWMAFGESYLLWDYQRTSCPLYLQIKWEMVEKEEKDSSPSVLGIDVTGGFKVEDSYEIVKASALVLLPEMTAIPLPLEGLPTIVLDCIQAIISHQCSSLSMESSSWQEELKETRHAEGLVQIPEALPISSDPSTWKCTKCGKSENLWMNLSDGFIGCGRQNWDGSGGCGASLDHFDESGKQYPLAVKLGTINPDGADVFSYSPEENDMVIDSKLKEHLKHWGIFIDNMKKSEKTMNELQIDLNMQYDFNKITETGQALEPLNGPGYRGIKNLGNSCYTNSVLQILFSLKEVRDIYVKMFRKIIDTSPLDIPNDFPTQMSKIGVYLMSEDNNYLEAISPRMFRTLVGKNHPEFSTCSQQDSVEYFLYLIEYMNRSEHTLKDRIGFSGDPTLSLFKFSLEDKVECIQSKKVRRVEREERVLQLIVPMEFQENCEQEVKRQKMQENSMNCSGESYVIPFESCLNLTFAKEIIPDFYSSATKSKGTAEKEVKFKSFPPYLGIQVRRYFISSDWTPKKIGARILVPEFLDLEKYRTSGPSETEEVLEDDEVHVDTKLNESFVSQLVTMGFSRNACCRAVLATNNTSVDAAMEWILSHMDDANFNDPVEEARSVKKEKSQNQRLVSNLMAMGFSEGRVNLALQNTGGDPDRAAEWLFCHMDDSNVAGIAENNKVVYKDGPGLYDLIGFISHMGNNTSAGHYVCHIKKHGNWAIFNDEKVAVSKNPPFDLGYFYVFKRRE